MGSGGLKTQIARVLEVLALERDLPLIGYGSTTFKRELRERGLEPDECYCVGREIADETSEGPDIAIEVAPTSGGLPKLAVYAGLGVREVWFWRRDRFEPFALEGETYRPSDRSSLVPDIDFEELAGFVRRPGQHAAVKAYRDLLRVRAG